MHVANEPPVVAGVATYVLEIFEELPAVDVIIVPIGGGSGASGNCIVRSALGAKTRVIGVQAAAADAFARSWRTGRRAINDSAATFAEGVATRETFDFTFGIGNAAIEVTALPHTGCGKFVERFGVEAMKFVNGAVGRRLNLRGINARVVQPGTIRVGDTVTRT